MPSNKEDEDLRGRLINEVNRLMPLMAYNPNIEI